jgi:hypothetical protein
VEGSRAGSEFLYADVVPMLIRAAEEERTGCRNVFDGPSIRTAPLSLAFDDFGQVELRF